MLLLLELSLLELLLSSLLLLLELLSLSLEELLLDELLSSSALDDEDEDPFFADLLTSSLVLPERPGAMAIFFTAPARFVTSPLIFLFSSFTLLMASLQPSGQFLAALAASSAALFFSSWALR